MTLPLHSYLANLATEPLRDDLRLVDARHVVGRFLRCEIDSVFQPIARLGDAGAQPEFTASQALARVHAEGGGELSPWRLFALAASDDDLVLLDRRCRVVHTLNFFASETGDRRLLLSVHERLLSAVAVDHGRAFRRVLDGLGIASDRVVITLPRRAEPEINRQCNALASYRLNGFRVAVTVDEPAQLRSLLARIRVDAVRIEARHLARPGWRDTIAAATAADAEVHATRVEDEAHRLQALALGATHWQGWHLAQPVGWSAALASL